MLKFNKVFEIPLKEIQWDEGLIFLVIACFPLLWSVQALPGGWSLFPVVVSWMVLYQVAKILNQQTAVEVDTVERTVKITEQVPFSIFSALFGTIKWFLGIEDPTVVPGRLSPKKESPIRRYPFERIGEIVIEKVTRHDQRESVTSVWITGGYQSWFRIAMTLKGGEEVVVKESLHEEESRMLAENLAKMIEVPIQDYSVSPPLTYNLPDLFKVENIRITAQNRETDEMIVTNHSGSPSLHFKPKTVQLIQRDHFHIMAKWDNSSYVTLLLLIILVLPLNVYALKVILELLHITGTGIRDLHSTGALTVLEKVRVIGLTPLLLALYFLAIKFLRDCLGSATLSIDPQRMHIITCPIFVKKHHMVLLDEVSSIRMAFGISPQISFLSDREEFIVYGSIPELSYVYWEMTTFFQSRLQRKLQDVQDKGASTGANAA